MQKLLKDQEDDLQKKQQALSERENDIDTVQSILESNKTSPKAAHKTLSDVNLHVKRILYFLLSGAHELDEALVLLFNFGHHA